MLVAVPALSPLHAAENTVTLHPQRAREGMVAAHNAVRARADADLPEMSWSRSAAAEASEWAEHLARNGCRMRHTPGLEDYGQNLYWAGPRKEVRIERDARTGEVIDRDVSLSVQDVDANKVVKSWASEAQWYDYESNTCQPPKGKSCGHYTQIVWSGTTAVGCAMAVCDSKGQIWVCDYAPPGNVIGERPY